MAEVSPITAKLKPHTKDLGNLKVRRSLPTIKHRSVGPWVFFDHFGPVSFKPGEGINVRPHPHINLATVTYLFEGEIFHRDSLGSALPIHPGAINLMVAGKGIVHSERTRDALLETGYDMHGLQLWMGLPEEFEEIEPAFFHHPASDLPSGDISGVKTRVMIGEAFGLASPVKTYSPTLYFEAELPPGGSLEIPDTPELAIYTVEGDIAVDGHAAPLFELAVLHTAQADQFTSRDGGRFAAIGGAPLGQRHMYWNFVSSRKERIEQAKADWNAGRFDKVPGDEEEFIPLPDV